jgi:putative transposase
LAHQPEEDAADLSRELGLQLRDKTPKRWVQSELREDRRNATRSNETWDMGLRGMISWRLGRSCVLTIVDTFSHHPPELDHQRHANLGWGFSG